MELSFESQRSGRQKDNIEMRQDKLTTKFQEALSQAQSLALANDNQFIEPEHVLSAMLEDVEGGTVSLVERAGGRVACVESPSDNMKVTVNEDRAPVEAILERRLAERGLTSARVAGGER